MKKYKTILLDIDGTLIDFEACERLAFIKALTHHNIEYNDELYIIYKHINTNLWQQYEQGEIDREFIFKSRFVRFFSEININYDGVIFEQTYQALLANEHQLIAGAVEVVQYLSNLYDLYVVTNGVASTQYKKLKNSGLDVYMKDIFISEMIGYQKPMKEFFEACFHRIDDLDLSKTMIIGDSLTSDMQGGENVGITTCWYNPDNYNNHTSVQLDYIISDLNELYDML